MGCAMDRIDLHCGRNVETSLFEAKRQPARASKKVDSYRTLFDLI